MEKLKSLFVLVGVLSVGVACSRDALEMTDGGTRVAYVNVSRGGGGAMFRSTIDPSTWAVSWALGDEIYYYTLPKSSGSSVPSAARPAGIRR